MSYKQLVQYPNHWQRDRELRQIADGHWLDSENRIWMPYNAAGDPEWLDVTPSQEDEGPLDFLYVNHTPRHVMIRYIGAKYDTEQPPGYRWFRHYDVIFLDDIEDGKVMIAMVMSSDHEFDVIDGEYHRLPIGLNGRNITPKNCKEYAQIIHYLEHEYLAEMNVYRKSQEYHNDQREG